MDDAVAVNRRPPLEAPSPVCGRGPAETAPRISARRLLNGRSALLVLGWTATGLALAGVVLPLLPATPFALVAAWAFARASPRFEHWLQTHRLLGPMVRDWRRRRAIPRRAKWIALASLVSSLAALAFLRPSPVLLILIGSILGVVGLWIASRPE